MGEHNRCGCNATIPLDDIPPCGCDGVGKICGNCAYMNAAKRRCSCLVTGLLIYPHFKCSNNRFEEKWREAQRDNPERDLI